MKGFSSRLRSTTDCVHCHIYSHGQTARRSVHKQTQWCFSWELLQVPPFPGCQKDSQPSSSCPGTWMGTGTSRQLKGLLFCFCFRMTLVAGQCQSDLITHALPISIYRNPFFKFNSIFSMDFFFLKNKQSRWLSFLSLG